MKQLIWKGIAKLVAQPMVSNAIIAHAKKHPYFHITSRNGSDVYMERYWVFNPYHPVTGEPRWKPFIPWSIRIHWIRREDRDEHLHDHPWNARTIILKGWYKEDRIIEDLGMLDHATHPIYDSLIGISGGKKGIYLRKTGDTASLPHGEYHRIREVSPGGAVTLFITGSYRGTWGFLVNGVKVKWREYLAERAQ